MLREPEHSLVAAWFAAGHTVTRIAYGVSGETFYAARRRQAMFVNLIRHGARHIEADAASLIAQGRLTVAQARAGVAWRLLCQLGPLYAKQIDKHLGVNECGRPIMNVLLQARAAEEVEGCRFFTVRAIGEREPHWTWFVAREGMAA